MNHRMWVCVFVCVDPATCLLCIATLALWAWSDSSPNMTLWLDKSRWTDESCLPVCRNSHLCEAPLTETSSWCRCRCRNEPHTVSVVLVAWTCGLQSSGCILLKSVFSVCHRLNHYIILKSSAPTRGVRPQRKPSLNKARSAFKIDINSHWADSKNMETNRELVCIIYLLYLNWF